MKETDNEESGAAFSTGVINLFPSEWYVDDCKNYEILVWKRYSGGRGACYISNSGSLDLNIDDCRDHFFPFNNYYLFRFKVRSLPGPLIHPSF